VIVLSLQIADEYESLSHQIYAQLMVDRTTKIKNNATFEWINKNATFALYMDANLGERTIQFLRMRNGENPILYINNLKTSDIKVNGKYLLDLLGNR
jgi:hypothetical protein